MGVKIISRGVKFYNEFKNDIGFGSNPLDFTFNLTGSVMEKIKTVQEVEVEWFSKTKDTASTWTVDTTNGSIESTGGDFITDGFSIGDEFIYEDISAAAGTNFIGQITSISSTVIYFTLISGSRTNVDTDAIIRGKSDLTAMNFMFGLLGNSESFNSISKVSGNDQGYYGTSIGARAGVGLPRSTSFVNFIPLGQFNGWRTGSLKAKFVSDNYSLLTAQSGSQRFEIEHEFTIVPYYLDGELSNLQNNIIPTLLNGNNSLKYSFSPGFRTVYSNPNTEKKTTLNDNLGSVAWFNENFNAFQNDYNIVSIDYEEAITGDTSDGLLIGSKTKTTIEVERLSGAFVGAERFGVYLSYLPEQSEYQNTLSTLTQNFIYDRALNNEGLAPVTGDDFITSMEASISGGNLIIEIESEYDASQKAFLGSKFSQSPTYFMIGVSVGDATLTNGNSNRVILLADVELYDESPDIPNLMEVTKFDIYQHDEVIGVDTGSSDSITWNEDNLAVDFEFKLNLLQEAYINSLEFQLVAYNDVTGQMFNLDRYVFNNIGSAIVSSNIQQLIANTDRGYNLAANSQFNEVSLSTDSLVLQEQFYSGVIGQKIKWQDWLLNNNVDNVFYDSLLPNDNKNFKSSNYSGLNNYSIRLLKFANLDGVSDIGVSGNTNYFFLSPAITVNDYDKDGNVTPIWSGVIETFHPTNGTNLQGKVLSGTNTIMKTTWTNLVPVVSLDDIWAIHRIEETGDAGNEIDELSSINPYPAPNRLIPLVGETQLKVYIDTGKVITECLVDGSQILSNISYNLSARINVNKGAIPVDAKITEEDVVKITEESETKIIE